jgi:hypothetical protein
MLKQILEFFSLLSRVQNNPSQLWGNRTKEKRAEQPRRSERVQTLNLFFSQAWNSAELMQDKAEDCI